MLAALAMAIRLATPDAAALAVETADRCLAVMRDEAEPVHETLTLADDRLAIRDLRRDGCHVTVDAWRGDDGAFATAVRAGLEARLGRWQVSEWRQTRVNESGPAVWTTMVVPDIRRHSAYFIQIIEPVAGSGGVLSFSYGIAP